MTTVAIAAGILAAVSCLFIGWIVARAQYEAR